MTDIQRNYGINSQAYNIKVESEKTPSREEVSPKSENLQNEDVNLDKNPAAAVGRSMVNPKYKFDSKNIEADIEDFKFNFSIAEEFAKDLIKEGCPPDSACDIAASMVYLAYENHNV